MNKKYSVITLIVGEYDFLRDPVIVDEDIEYICVTNRTDLKSNIWNICYENINYKDPIELVWKIKHENIFKYCHTNTILRIDSSILINTSISKLLENFNNSNDDMWCMLHPYRNTYLDEYKEWVNGRNMDIKYVNSFILYMNENNFDINKKGLIECTIIFYKKNKLCSEFNQKLYNLLKTYSNCLERNDLCWFSALLINEFNSMRITFLCEQAIHSKYFTWYFHNSLLKNNGYIIYNINLPIELYWNNKKIKCKYLI